MSVTSLRAYQNSGSDKPRYGLPDAPLDSCPLVFARVRPTKTGIPLPFSSFLSGTTTCSWCRRTNPALPPVVPRPQASRSANAHAATPAIGRSAASSLFLISIGREGVAPASTLQGSSPVRYGPISLLAPALAPIPSAASRSSGSWRPAPRTPPHAPRFP
jgi:hypothetical protein